MELKWQWIKAKKQQLLKDMSECDCEVGELVLKSTAETKKKEEQFVQYKKQSQLKIQQLQNEYSKVATQVKSLEAVIVAKEEQLDRLKNEHSVLSKGNEDKSQVIQDKTNRVLQLQHSLKVMKEENQKYILELKNQIRNKENEHRQEIQKMVYSHQQLLLEKQNNLNKIHEEALAELKKSNLKLLQKIQIDHAAANTKVTALSKQNETEYSRIAQQNTKLVSNINELKFKLLNLESNLSTKDQQQKIALKEAQISRENYRRQVQMLKDERNDLKSKNRKLNEKVDQISWELRELNLKKDEDMKKVKQEVDHSFYEILSKAEEERNKMTQENQVLQASLKEKESTIGELEKIGLQLKELIEKREEQLSQLKENIVEIQKQTDSKNTEELRKEIIRKNCEIDVLKEEVKRLKHKVNTIANTYQDHLRKQEQTQKQNKMLLSQIIFLRQKEKQTKRKTPNNSRVLDELNSEKSQDIDEIQEYKKLIEMMSEDMNEAHTKLIEKDIQIQKLQAQIQKYQKQLHL